MPAPSKAVEPMPAERGPGSPRHGLLLSVAWVPFAFAAWWARDRPGFLLVVTLVVVVLSAVHQPVTLVLVHGDGEQFQSHRRLFILAPVLLLTVSIVGPLVALPVVAVIGGLWNAQHTTMQRHGLARMLAGPARSPDGSAERRLFLAGLLLVLTWTAASPWTEASLARLPLSGLQAELPGALSAARPMARLLLVPVAVGTVVFAVAWTRQERSTRATLGSSRSRDLYLASTGIAVLVAAIDPLVGSLALAGSHAVEYFVVVGARCRDLGAVGRGGVAARAVRAGGPWVALAFWFSGYFVVRWSLGHVGATVPLMVWTFVGATHFLYDAVIWRSSRPTRTAASSNSERGNPALA